MNGTHFILTLVGMGLFSGMVFSVIRIIGRIVDRKVSGGGRDLAELRASVDALRAEIAEQGDQTQRLAELEERLEFAERLLARQSGQAKLPGAN